MNATRILSDDHRKVIGKAYAILMGIPAERFVPHLNHYFQIEVGNSHSSWTKTAYYPQAKKRLDKGHVCTTFGCSAGWLMLHPDFALKLKEGECESLYAWVERHFGQHNYMWDSLFSSRNIGLYDHDNGVDELNDKQLVLYRFLRHLGWNPGEARTKAEQDTEEGEKLYREFKRKKK